MVYSGPDLTVNPVRGHRFSAVKRYIALAALPRRLDASPRRNVGASAQPPCRFHLGALPLGRLVALTHVRPDALEAFFAADALKMCLRL